MDAVMLRLAAEEDAASIAQVHLAAREAAPMPPSIHSADEVRSWIVRLLKTDTVWVAARGGRIAGYARFSRQWLDDLYVLPQYQGSGVGTALLGLVKDTRPAGFCLWVFQSNIPARSFYRRHGLVELESTEGSGNEEKAPDVRMAWPGTDPPTFLRGLVQEVDEQLGGLLERRAALARALQTYENIASSGDTRAAAAAEAIALRAPSLGPQRLQRILSAIDTETSDAARKLVDA